MARNTLKFDLRWNGGLPRTGLHTGTRFSVRFSRNRTESTTLVESEFNKEHCLHPPMKPCHISLFQIKDQEAPHQIKTILILLQNIKRKKKSKTKKPKQYSKKMPVMWPRQREIVDNFTPPLLTFCVNVNLVHKLLAILGLILLDLSFVESTGEEDKAVWAFPLIIYIIYNNRRYER